MTTIPTLAGGEIAELREAIRGAVFAPGDEGYDDARKIWNGMFDDVHPALVVRCAGTADVMRAIELARSEGLEIAVRGGSHSIPGFSTTEGHRHRSVDDEGRRRRSRRAPRGRPARPAVAGPRRRDAGLRARRHRRARLDHRRLGLHPRRRHRLARAQAGPGLRPPRGRRRGDRRRARSCAPAPTATPSSCGGCAVAAATSASSPRWSSSSSRSGPMVYGGIMVFAGERAADVCRVLRRLDRGRPARRADDDPQPDDRAAGAVPARVDPRQAGRDRRRLLRRPGRRGRARARAGPRPGRPGGRPAAAAPLHRACSSCSTRCGAAAPATT